MFNNLRIGQRISFEISTRSSRIIHGRVFSKNGEFLENLPIPDGLHIEDGSLRRYLSHKLVPSGIAIRQDPILPHVLWLEATEPPG